MADQPTISTDFSVSRRGIPPDQPVCRLCGTALRRSLIDLGPLPVTYDTVAPGTPPEPLYPLHVRMCDECRLVQLANHGVSAPVHVPDRSACLHGASVMQRRRRFAEAMCARLKLNAESLVIEVGSNAGSLLEPFQAAGVPVLGIEPDAVAAAVAVGQGVPTEIVSFDTESAMEIAVRQGCADLVIAHDVLNVVPDLFEFAAGFASILRPNGVLTLQVPHLLALLQRVQFDAFRHGCYAYLSLKVLERLLRAVGLRAFDAERVPDHGGSLRIHACHADGPYVTKPGLKAVRGGEANAGLDGLEPYDLFREKAAAAQSQLKAFLQLRRAANRRIAGYGASVRESNLLNACGIAPDLMACVADPDAAKQGQLLPGCRIPVVRPAALLNNPPDDVLVLPWTTASEATGALQPLRTLGVQLWTPLPHVARI